MTMYQTVASHVCRGQADTRSGAAQDQALPLPLHQEHRTDERLKQDHRLH